MSEQEQRPVSEKLRGLLDRLGKMSSTAAELQEEIFKQGAEEGFSKSEINKMIKQTLEQGGYSVSHYKHTKPDELKNPEHVAAIKAGIERARAVRNNNQCAETALQSEKPTNIPDDAIHLDIAKFYPKLWSAYRNNTNAWLIIEDGRVTKVILPGELRT